MYNITTINEFQKILDTKKIIVIDFWADWCAPCKTLLPHLKNFEDHYQGNVIVVKINVNECEDDLLSKFNVTAIPSIFFFNKGKFLENQIIVGSNIGDIYSTTNLIISQLN